MKVLAIGNSFSQDAMRYLHSVAEERGYNLECTNLYIGGCSLEKHYNNYKENSAAYSEEYNGQTTGRAVSIPEVLARGDWDVVTLQNVSSESPFYKTYQPYLSFLADRVREACPKAKIYMHAVWCYDESDPRLKQLGFKNHEEMGEANEEAYRRAAAEIGADGIIPSGETVLNLYRLGIAKPHRDGFHLDLGFGRYAVALTWFETLFGVSSLKSLFCDFDVPVLSDNLVIARRAARAAVTREIAIREGRTPHPVRSLRGDLENIGKKKHTKRLKG